MTILRLTEVRVHQKIEHRSFTFTGLKASRLWKISLRLFLLSDRGGAGFMAGMAHQWPNHLTNLLIFKP